MVPRRLSRDGTQITIGFALKTDLAPPDSSCSLSYSCGLVLWALLKVPHLCDGSPFIRLHPAAAIWFKAIRGRIIRPSRKAETVVGPSANPLWSDTRFLFTGGDTWGKQGAALHHGPHWARTGAACGALHRRPWRKILLGKGWKRWTVFIRLGLLR